MHPQGDGSVSIKRAMYHIVFTFKAYEIQTDAFDFMHKRCITKDHNASCKLSTGHHMRRFQVNVDILLVLLPRCVAHGGA